MDGVEPRANHVRAQVAKRFQPGIHFVWIPGFLCGNAGSGRVSRQVGDASLTRLISSKNLWILPKCIKDSVDLPDFVKESVPQIQILCTFQADFSIRNSHLYLARNP